VYFKSGEPLLVWLPCAIDEAYRGVEGHQPLEPRLRKWGETFEEKYPARILKKDKRYAGVYYTEQAKHYMDAGKAVGGGNYGIAPPIGKFSFDGNSFSAESSSCLGDLIEVPANSIVH